MWLYKGEQITSIDQLPEESFGFVYKITNLTKNKAYIGKKFFWSERKVKLGKKELAAQTDKRKSKSKKVKKQSDWLTYTGSSEELNRDIANGDMVVKEILCICKDRMCVTYQEILHQFKYDVLEREDFYNISINNIFFKGNTGNIL